jgi:HlyD family secretion protein
MKLKQQVLSWLKGLKKSQKIIGGIIVIFLIIAISGQLGSFRKDSLDVYEIKRGDISETITNSGNISASGNATVFSPSTGIVEAVYVKNGEIVSQGQNLIQVKGTATEIERANALAAYQSAQAAANISQQAKITNQSLLEAGRKTVIDASIALNELNERRNTGANNPITGKPYTPDDIESIKSTYTSAKKSFESLENKYLDSDDAIAAAQSSVTSAWLSYQATQNGMIKAPIAGTVMNIAVEPGDAVSGVTSSVLSSAGIKPLLRISTLEKISMRVSLSEIDVAKVSRGQKATVVIDAIPERTFTATVSRVDTVGTNTNAVVTYDTYIEVIESDERMRPGMSATVTITTDPKKGVLLVPNTGLTKENNDITVQVQKGRSSVSKIVKIGVKNTSQSEVLSGLSEGEKIIIPKSK